ncbi:MAG: hypothetical protein RL204_208 [Bacteroidota bacterium]
MRKLIVFLFLLISICAFSQTENTAFFRRGMLSAQLTLSPSYMLEEKVGYFYLHGNIEGFVSENISISGDGFISMGSLTSDEQKLDYNNNLLFGGYYHFTNGHNDFYAGFQPGLAFTQIHTNELMLVSRPSVTPIISSVVGYRYFINDYFHFFAQARYIYGTHYYDEKLSLAEIRLSAGLGFNFSLLKLKK